MDARIQEANFKEYSVIKRIVKQITESRKEKSARNSNHGNEDEMEYIKNTYGVNDQNNENKDANRNAQMQKTQGKENSHLNQEQTDHPQQEKSPPSKKKMTGEGRKV